MRLNKYLQHQGNNKVRWMASKTGNRSKMLQTKVINNIILWLDVVRHKLGDLNGKVAGQGFQVSVNHRVV